MEKLSYVIEILEASVKKNGDKPLTTSHLLNILKMAGKQQADFEEKMDRNFDPHWD